MIDFIFGTITSNAGKSILDMDIVGSIAEEYDCKYFTLQLNRLLRNCGQRLFIDTGSTSPRSFSKILAKIEPSTIGALKLYPDVVVETNTIVLRCDLYLEHGIITFRPYWTGYTELRFLEMVGTCLVPINRSGLQHKASLINSNGKYDRLYPTDITGDNEAAIECCLSAINKIAVVLKTSFYDQSRNQCASDIHNAAMEGSKAT